MQNHLETFCDVTPCYNVFLVRFLIDQHNYREYESILKRLAK